MGRSILVVLLAVLSLFDSAPCQAGPTGSDFQELRSRTRGSAASDRDRPEAKNVILFIGDGMGESHREAARWKTVGPGGALSMDRLPFEGRLQTASADSSVTDSAAAGTAIATGVKTENGVIGMDPALNRLETILEYVRGRGKSVGMVTTTQLSHATPASFAAHVPRRGRHPEIAEQIIRTGVDVLLGGGENAFLPTSETGCHPEPGIRTDGVNLIEGAIADGYIHICRSADFETLDPAGTTRLLGIFSDEGMLRPFSPSLTEMTRVAIEILARDREGFFLMVEGGQIDWASHANDAENAIADTIGLDNAVAVALRYVQRDPETLLIVAADHETGGMHLTLEPTGRPDEDGPFVMADGTKFYVNWKTDGHTSAAVPITALGPASDMAEGIMDHTGVFRMMRQAMD